MKMHWQILVALGLGAKRNWHIFFAIIAGFIVGILFPAAKYGVFINVLSFIGEGFLRLIQMLVIPLVVSAILVGISSLGNTRQLGKIGFKMIFYYLLITVIAVMIGATLSLVFEPGIGVTSFVEQEQMQEVQTLVTENLTTQKENLSSIFLNLIPKNPIEALIGGISVPAIIFLIIFAAALGAAGEIARPIISFFESLFAVTMKVTDWIMVLAPPGIFAMTASSIAKYGTSIFNYISVFIFIIIIGVLLQLLVVYPAVLKFFANLNFTKLYRAVAESMMVAFGTASSAATLPVTIACCERRAGISNKICSLVLPLGATINMDGTALFQTAAAIFLMQAYGITLEPMMIIQIMVLAIVASSTSAGIPSGGVITIAIILGSLGLEPEQLAMGFAFLFTIERFADMFRTLSNVTSDTVVAAVIAKSEDELDMAVFDSDTASMEEDII